MRPLLVVFLLLLSTPVAFAQNQSADDKVKEELKKLHAEYKEAADKKDRAALEHIFADGYVWVQGNGSVTSKSRHIDNILGNSSEFLMAVPSFDQLTIYGNLAILRATEGRRGLFATTVFAKRDGRWQFVHAQGTLLPGERKPIALDPKALDAFVGNYEFGPGAVATVAKEGNVLTWKGGRRPKAMLTPMSDTHFFVQDTGAEMIFTKDDRGRPTGVTLRIGTCQEQQARRVE